ncbi:GDSL esterase/lipase 5 [Striga hermonthica]|uniref:GDSL esterase/lipase 5 n=1 Tax=Striga hermonthica TaxID=68872 RepID=A0A9N7RH03_STRHE|nr:GDSL esterase/lipase 5 [Striga hermonthica]
MANLPSFLVILITINALAITLEAGCNKPALFPFGDSYLESVGLAQQLKNFKDEIKNLTRALGSNAAKKIVSNAVYLISLGASDFISPFTLNVTIPDEQQYVNMMIGNLSTVFDTIYDLGGRKFAWLNVLNLACAPGLKAVNKENGCLKKASEIVGLYNEALKTLLSDKEKSLDGSRIVLFDLASGVAKMTAEPTIYGFEEAESACCGSGNSNGIFSCGRIPEHYNLCPNASDHVFFDSFHPTGNAYEQITKEIWNQRNGGVKKLFDCLG